VPNLRKSMQTPRVIVIGAGAAGLMAAGQAATQGASTLVLDKMDRAGRKLHISGKGRCNLTNTAPVAEFVERFGPNGRFLRQAFARFFSDELIALLADLGVPAVTERGGRVFPASGAADAVVAALSAWIANQGATLRTRARAEGLVLHDGCVTGVRVRRARPAGAAEEILPAQAVVLATGGASYPGTGSSGDGYRLAAEAGHTIVPIRPALVPLETAGDTARRLQGLSLRNVRVRALVRGRRHAEAFGEMLFTHFGVSGPIILSMSGRIVDALSAGASVAISIDLKPALDDPKLDERLRRDLSEQGRRGFASILRGLLPRKLIPVCIEQTGIAADAPGHQITGEQRRRLRAWLKDLRLEVTGHRPLAEAIITAGGVDLREVDPRTMASRLAPGLFLAGEVLDLDADTGGFNLQAAFSTGWVAGRAAAAAAIAAAGTAR
jgi:predicted Rossmann fold flavoprotein